MLNLWDLGTIWKQFLPRHPERKTNRLFGASMSSDIHKITMYLSAFSWEVTIGKNNSPTKYQPSVCCSSLRKTSILPLKNYRFSVKIFEYFILPKLKHKKSVIPWVRIAMPSIVYMVIWPQAQRTKVCTRFRHKTVKLYSPQTAARGIDVKNQTHVIHYHLPDDVENYIHRRKNGARWTKGISIATPFQEKHNYIRSKKAD